jgi:hypothetical protein
MPFLLGYSIAPADPQVNPAAREQDKSTCFVLICKILINALIQLENTISCSSGVPGAA